MGQAPEANLASNLKPLPAPPFPHKSRPSHGLRAGIAVFHTKFGEGKVLAIEGTGDDAAPRSTSPPRHQVAGVECGEVDGGGLIAPAGATAALLRCVRQWPGRAGYAVAQTFGHQRAR